MFMPIHSRKRPSAGFTLIELIVVIAIIAILAAILFPVFQRVRENARRVSCASNMKQIGLAITQYNQDNEEFMPISLSYNYNYDWKDQIYPYVKSTGVFRCPDYNANARIGTAAGSFGPLAEYDGYTGNAPATPFSVKIPNSYEACCGRDYGLQDGGAAPLSATRNLFTNITTTHPGCCGANNAIIVTVMSNIVSPASCVTIFDSDTGNTVTWDTGPNVNGKYLTAHSMQNHGGLANFLFADGHVKTELPSKTGFPINMWNIENTTNWGDATPGPADTSGAHTLGTELLAEDKKLTTGGPVNLF